MDRKLHSLEATWRHVKVQEIDAHIKYVSFVNHQLTLKIGAIIMLIRNLDSKRGLCNGTRLTVKFMYTYFVDAEIIIDKHIGSRVFIPRIELSPSDTVLPFILKRRQNPVIMAFAMTINKSQGENF
jgi:ATP-dependent exoDNAse (exonuclease V) alpha subunit